MPLIRRIPKRGFNNANFAIRYIPVNLDSLNRFDNGATVDEAAFARTPGESPKARKAGSRFLAMAN